MKSLVTEINENIAYEITGYKDAIIKNENIAYEITGYKR